MTRRTDEQRQNMSIAAKRRWSNPEQRSQASEKMRGRKPSPKALAAAARATQSDDFRDAQSRRMVQLMRARHVRVNRSLPSP